MANGVKPGSTGVAAVDLALGVISGLNVGAAIAIPMIKGVIAALRTDRVASGLPTDDLDGITDAMVIETLRQPSRRVVETGRAFLASIGAFDRPAEPIG